MSFRLPTAERNPEAREAMGDIAHVAEILDPANIAKLPSFREVSAIARRTLRGSAGSRVCIICIRADDERWLVSVGRYGGWKKLWNFGNGRN